MFSRAAHKGIPGTGGRPSILRGGFRHLASVTASQASFRKRNLVWGFLSFRHGASPSPATPSKLRWHSRGVTPLMRLRCIDLGKSVTAKLNSAHPSPDLRHCPRADGFRQRQVRRKVTTPSFDSIARQLFPRFRLEIRVRRCCRRREPIGIEFAPQKKRDRLINGLEINTLCVTTNISSLGARSISEPSRTWQRVHMNDIRN